MHEKRSRFDFERKGDMIKKNGSVQNSYGKSRMCVGAGNAAQQCWAYHVVIIKYKWTLTFLGRYIKEMVVN